MQIYRKIKVFVGTECVKSLAFTLKFTAGGNSDPRQVAIRRSLLQVFCAYFANNFTYPRDWLNYIFFLCHHSDSRLVRRRLCPNHGWSRITPNQRHENCLGIPRISRLFSCASKAHLGTPSICCRLTYPKF